MSNHTKGPWAIEEHSEVDLVRVGPGVCLTDKANAALIAAAPDMLEALDLVERLLNSRCGVDAGLANAFEIVQAVLKKAKGESK
jgi:hypothetical protein